MLQEVSTHSIVERIQSGDKSAFETLFREYYQHLCHFAFQFLNEKAASEEIVQDLFYKIWENRATLNITSSLKAYLFTSVRNHCLNQIKHLKIREAYKVDNEQQISYSEQQENDPALQYELQERIEIAISSLPPERQKIFKLSRYEDKKYKEIAEELSLSVKTVEAQMGKALRFLRAQLADYLPLILVGIWTWVKKM